MIEFFQIQRRALLFHYKFLFMYKKMVSAIGICLISIVAYAQNSNIDQLISQIEENNKQLQAYSSLMESKHLKLKSGNNLPDPEASIYHLPWGDNSTGSYTEMEISQSFEFPTVYGARKELIGKEKEKMQLEYDALRQEILLKAKKHLLEVIYLNKKMAVEQQRIQQAKQVYSQIQEMYKKKEVGVLEVNKAKVSWMQEQFKMQELKNRKKNLLILLKKLNGGNEVSVSTPEFTNNLTIASMDSLWQKKKQKDPDISVLKQKEKVARQEIKVSKNKSLPDLTAGFNYQGSATSTLSGIYGGISIPLWNSNNKVKAAKAQYQYQQDYSNTKMMDTYADFQEKYNNYEVLLDKYNEYQSTMQGLKSAKLLLEAYELGEISFIEYYMELQFFRQAYDSMLKVENQLRQIKAEILKHQL